MSHVLHQLSRRHLIWGALANRLRPLLFDSCEGICFDFDGGAIAERAAPRAELGVELFVIDSAWFVGDYNSLSGSSWKGQNPNQVLYSFDKHPDWALQAEGYLPS
ncbi:hypothetical protein ACQRIU_004968 [Beauveria bassiana]